MSPEERIISELADARVLLRNAEEDVCVLIDISGGGLPAIVHWGADLGPVDAAAFAQVQIAREPTSDPNSVDQAVRLAVVPEARTGWTGRPGLSGSRAGRDWSPWFRSDEVLLDGEPISPDPKAVSTGRSVQVHAADPDAGLELDITVELLAGGVLRANATVTNTGTDGYQVDDLVLAFPVPGQARDLLDFAGRWSKERVPQRSELTVGTHLREGRKGRTGTDAATLVHLGTPGFGFGHGEIWSLHTGWSGNHTHYAERLFNGVQVVGGGELLLPGEVVLANGESYTSPWVYGSYGLGLDAVARRFHHYLRSRPQHPNTVRPVTLNVWEAVYFDHDLTQLLALAERAAELGIERYVLDDGWFGARRNDLAGLGDWQVSSDVWPDGLSPLIDRVNELGMEFGLWFEPEMINLDSDAARAHPDWILATGDRLPPESRHQQVINLGIPECYGYIRDSISALLDEYAIAYIKWDHNRDLIDAGTRPGGEPGVHAQTEACYRLMAELKERHPGLEIESCSSGGGRVDLGVLQHTDRVWVSDCIDPLERQQANRWTTQLIPPELMGSHIASGRSHTTGRSHDLSFRGASAVFGHLGVEWDLTEASAAEFSALGQWIAFYKEQRDLLFGGDLVRVDHPDPTFTVSGVVAPDRSRALFELAAISRSEVTNVGAFRLPGLDSDQSYLVRPIEIGPWEGVSHRPAWWSNGVTLSGRALATVGLQPPRLLPEHAVLISVDAV